MKKICPNGHWANTDKDNFCYICGEKLFEAKDERCSKCKKILYRLDRFCPKCGTKREE